MRWTNLLPDIPLGRYASLFVKQPPYNESQKPARKPPKRNKWPFESHPYETTFEPMTALAKQRTPATRTKTSGPSTSEFQQKKFDVQQLTSPRRNVRTHRLSLYRVTFLSAPKCVRWQRPLYFYYSPLVVRNLLPARSASQETSRSS